MHRGGGEGISDESTPIDKGREGGGRKQRRDSYSHESTHTIDSRVISLTF